MFFESNFKIRRRDYSMKKTELEMAKEGEFLREYGKNHFVVVSEALSIGRVKWNMVPIGAKGQKDLVFYMTTEQMLGLCSEILNGVFAKKIAADQNAYPSAYQYMTGEDGSLRLNIGGGKVGCRVQMQDKKANPVVNYTMAVSVEALLTMARKYTLCTGMTPVAPGSYYASVIASFEEGREERKGFRKPKPEEIGDSVDANNVVDESAEPTHKAEPNKEPTKADVKKETPKPADKPKNDDDVDGNFTLTVKGNKTLQRGLYVFDATDDKGAAVKLTFRKEEADKYSWFASFENSLAGGETKELKIRGQKEGVYILYKGPAK
jgi:hypothetical protein